MSASTATRASADGATQLWGSGSLREPRGSGEPTELPLDICRGASESPCRVVETGERAVDAKHAEVVAHFAPGDERPDLAPEDEPERADPPPDPGAGLVTVADRQARRVADGRVEQVQPAAGDAVAAGAAEGVDRGAVGGAGDLLRDDGGDLGQRLGRGTAIAAPRHAWTSLAPATRA